MKRMFGVDDAMPLVSFSGRPENCPNLGVSLSACPDVGRNSSGSKLMSICVVHSFGLMPSSGWDFVKAVAARNRGIAATARCCWLLSGVIAGCSWLLFFSRCCSKLQGFCGRDREAWLFFVG